MKTKPQKLPFSQWLRANGLTLFLTALVLGWIGRDFYQRHLKASLIDAVEDGDSVRVHALLARGVDPNTITRDSLSHREISLLEIALGDMAIHKRDAEIAEALLEKGADPNLKGGQLLFSAIDAGKDDLVRLL